QERLAKPGAGGDHGGVSRGIGDALLQHVQFLGFEHRDAGGHRLEVVDEQGGAAAEPSRNGPRVGDPWRAGQPCDAAIDRSGDAGAQGVYRIAPRLVEKRLDEFLEALEVDRHVLARDDGDGPIGVVLEQAHQRLRSSDIGRQQHALDDNRSAGGSGSRIRLLTSRASRSIVAVRVPVTVPSFDRHFAGQHVALVGRLSVLSRREVRSIVERLGGLFSPDVTPRTSVVIAGADGAPFDSPARVISESDLCALAGLPDIETLRGQYYSARDLRGMYPVLRDEHLRYLEKWGLVRPVIGRYSFADLHVLRQAAGEIERGAP